VIRNISFVAVIVKDTRKALEWYKDKLDFVVRVDTGSHHVEVCPPDAETAIHLCETRDFDYESDETGICFAVDDIYKTYEELTKRGVEFTSKPWHEAPGLWLASFKDLDGNNFYIFQHK